MVKIDGKKLAQAILNDLKSRPRPVKKLAAVFIGNNPASESFLKQKRKMAEELGIEFVLYQYDEAISGLKLKEEISNIQTDPAIGGIIVQLPLPEKFNQESIILSLAPEKDVDALSLKAIVNPLPVEVVKDLLLETGWDLENKIVAVIGKGILVGKPVAKWLEGKCRKLIILDSKSDLNELREADLVISGAGRAGLIKPEILKTGAGVIDFGFSIIDGKISGDLDTSGSLSELSFYTPTPGGTGPILVAEIFKNFYKLNERKF